VGIRRRRCAPGADQAHTDLERKRQQHAHALRQLSASPSSSSDPVAISTLRGQLADNRQWSADPSCPAIVVGTVDMIGSRLLFGGYGIGFKTRPMHAGFLGQDALLVHDEAHLEVPFQRLIEAVRREQENEPAPLGDGLRLNLMALTATSRGNASLELSAKDRDHPEVKKRIDARKKIQLQEYDDEKKLANLLVEHALAHKDSGQAVLVFARSVEVVEKVVEQLLKVKPTVALTGTMRGKERDALSNDATFRRFLPDPEPGQETVYLVCTSAGEIGINISADHLVCDLSTFESMAQRFGRINRFGTRTDTRIVVLHPKTFAEKDERDSRRRKTLDLLHGLAGDGSPAALSKLDANARLEAFEPEPTTLLTSEILFDAWALTTLRERLPGRPPLEPYLHGLQEQEPPTTTVAWRLEVEIIGETLRAHHPPTDLLEEYPLKPHEVLRDRTDRVLKHITTLATKHPETPVWLLDEDGTLEFPTLKELADKNRKERLQGRTLLLPPSVGGLANGFLNGAVGTADDVGDDWGVIDGARRRVRLWDSRRPALDPEDRYQARVRRLRGDGGRDGRRPRGRLIPSLLELVCQAPVRR
jgi:CRISPR-associated endonuclease/helicase Cas3